MIKSELSARDRDRPGTPPALPRIAQAHSDEEAREIIVGHSRANGLLMVCFVEPTERRVRIISARRATRSEQHDYEDHVTP